MNVMYVIGNENVCWKIILMYVKVEKIYKNILTFKK